MKRIRLEVNCKSISFAVTISNQKKSILLWQGKNNCCPKIGARIKNKWNSILDIQRRDCIRNLKISGRIDQRKSNHFLLHHGTKGLDLEALPESKSSN